MVVRGGTSSEQCDCRLWVDRRLFLGDPHTVQLSHHEHHGVDTTIQHVSTNGGAPTGKSAGRQMRTRG